MDSLFEIVEFASAVQFVEHESEADKPNSRTKGDDAKNAKLLIEGRGENEGANQADYGPESDSR